MRGKLKARGRARLERPLEECKQAKACSRAKATHPFHLLNSWIGHRRTRDRGPAKNCEPRCSLLALANLELARWRRLVADLGIDPE